MLLEFDMAAFIPKLRQTVVILQTLTFTVVQPGNAAFLLLYNESADSIILVQLTDCK